MDSALERSLTVFFKGCGGLHPLLTIFTYRAAYKFLKKHNETSWDKNLSLQLKIEKQ